MTVERNVRVNVVNEMVENVIVNQPSNPFERVWNPEVHVAEDYVLSLSLASMVMEHSPPFSYGASHP